MKKWISVEEFHNHALAAVEKPIEKLVSIELTQKYYTNPKNKGWIGNSIESDWFDIPNNTKQEADVPHLGLELKVTPIVQTRNGWSAKERLFLNIFNFNDEHKRSFQKSSFLEKANLIELMYYEYIKDVASPELIIKAATLFDLYDIPEEDMLIIEQDWNIIIQKIKEGKAEELSDSLTKYLGATTKGGKTESNLTTQPFSDEKAHRRAFTIKGSYMTQFARKVMGTIDEKVEKIITNQEELKTKTFEEIVLGKYKQFIGKTKRELADYFNVPIPLKNDKGSSAILAKKMLNLDGNIQDSEEFKKAGIAVKIVTVESGKKRTTEAFKLIVPEDTLANPEELIDETWPDSVLREYLTSYQFMLVVFEKTKEDTIFRGVKFWHVPYEDLEGDIKEVWENTKQVFSDGVVLTYKQYENHYEVLNNLPKSSDKKTLHVRSSAGLRSYKYHQNDSITLPVKSRWIDRPIELSEELTDSYITKQAWWLNQDYMYKQIRKFFS